MAALLLLSGCKLVPTADPAVPAETAGRSADRLIFWTKCDQLVPMTDQELDMWKSRGVDGFVCMVNHLAGMGGTQDFSGDPEATLEGSNYQLQRQLRDSDLGARTAARDMKLYLGAYLVNYSNPQTPLSEWFDDAGWSELALPKLNDLAGAAKLLGFAGVAFDQELYPQEDAQSTATWDWNYPGNTHSETEVRAKVRERGQQVMDAILSGFPGAELMAYDVQLPESWEELVQEEVNGDREGFAERLDIDFLDGLSSVEGYEAIRLIDATFYKTPHLGTWDTALEYNSNRLYSYFSRRLSNWEYASSRLFVSPFSWIDQGPCGCGFDDPQPPGFVKEQLLAFRKWGVGGEFANFAYQGLDDFDYSPYVGAMQAASAPAVVDPEPPTLKISSAGGSDSASIQGTAADNRAIRAVRWSDDRGGSGVARLDWKISSGDYQAGYQAETRWSFPIDELTPDATEVTITAEDIQGHTAVQQSSL